MSVSHLERWTILGSRAAVIIDARDRDIGVTEPLLHLGDVGLVVECIDRHGRTKRMRADLKAELRRVAPHQPIDAIGGDRPFKASRAVVAHRPKQRSCLIGAVPGCLEIVVDQPIGARMQRHIARLADLWQIPRTEVSRQLKENMRALFRKF